MTNCKRGTALERSVGKLQGVCVCGAGGGRGGGGMGMVGEGKAAGSEY